MKFSLSVTALVAFLPQMAVGDDIIKATTCTSGSAWSFKCGTEVFSCNVPDSATDWEMCKRHGSTSLQAGNEDNCKKLIGFVLTEGPTGNYVNLSDISLRKETIKCDNGAAISNFVCYKDTVTKWEVDEKSESTNCGVDPYPPPDTVTVATVTPPPTAPPTPPPVIAPTDAPKTPAPVPVISNTIVQIVESPPTEAPIEPTLAPVQPTEAPVEPTDAPVEPTLAPVDPTEAPVEPTEAPIEPTDAPVEPTLAPVEPTEAPVEPTLAPVEPTEAPVEPTDAPVDPTAAPVVPGCTMDYESGSSGSVCGPGMEVVTLQGTVGIEPTGYENGDGIIYNIVQDAAAGTVTFNVANPFDASADIYVKHESASSVAGFLEPTCDAMPQQAPCVSPEAGDEITVMCRDRGYAIVYLYFAVEDTSLATEAATINDCCYPAEVATFDYSTEGSVVELAYKIDCSCPEASSTRKLLRGFS